MNRIAAQLPAKLPGIAGKRHALLGAWLRAAALLSICGQAASTPLAQRFPLSERVATAFIEQDPIRQLSAATHAVSAYPNGAGTALMAMDAVWYNSANGDYFRYASSKADSLLDSGLTNSDPSLPGNALDRAMFARHLLRLYRVTLDSKYLKTAGKLRTELAPSCGIPVPASRPTPSDGDSAPHECAAAPFLAEYATLTHRQGDLPAIAESLRRWEKQLLSPVKTGAKVSASTAPAIAVIAVALVDSLPNFSSDGPAHTALIQILDRLAARLQNSASQGASPRYLPHASSPAGDTGARTSACLLIYALLKGARLGYLPEQSAAYALRAWSDLQRQYTPIEKNGDLRLHDSKAGLMDLGAFLLTATEAEIAANTALGRGRTVMLDAWFNSQQREDAAGAMSYFHYKWDDFSDSGYSLFGSIWQSYGVATRTLYTAPTRQNLAGAQFYIIVSPDNPAKNPQPHYMTEQDAIEIAAWVQQGGVLVMLENDPLNADIDHMNRLADQFGIHFDKVLHHHVLGEQVDDGRIPVSAGGPLFHRSHTLYMKDTCAISLGGPATALLRDRGDVVMAAAKDGRGVVFATVDPWVYNEYTDGRKNPVIYNQFDNFSAGRELVRRLLEQGVPAERAKRNEKDITP